MELLQWLLDDVESAASLVFMKRPPWLFRGCIGRFMCVVVWKRDHTTT